MFTTHSVESIASQVGRVLVRLPRARAVWPSAGMLGIRNAALGLLLLGHVMLAGGLQAAEEKGLFAGTFQDTLAKPWTTMGGTWQVQQGLLQQVDAGLDDPSKAVLVVGDPDEMSSGIVVTAKLRLDTWKGDDQARAESDCAAILRAATG